MHVKLLTHIIASFMAWLLMTAPVMACCVTGHSQNSPAHDSSAAMQKTDEAAPIKSPVVQRQSSCHDMSVKPPNHSNAPNRHDASENNHSKDKADNNAVNAENPHPKKSHSEKYCVSCDDTALSTNDYPPVNPAITAAQDIQILAINYAPSGSFIADYTLAKSTAPPRYPVYPIDSALHNCDSLLI